MNSRLLDDLFQEVDIILEGRRPGFCQRKSREIAPVPDSFGDGHITGLLKRPDAGGDIAIGHFQNVPEFRERELRRSSQ